MNTPPEPSAPEDPGTAVRGDHLPAPARAIRAPYAPGSAEMRRVNRFNKVARRILRSPLHRVLSKRLMLISVTGRKTGKIYTTPVAYAQDGDHLLIAAGGRWRENLSARPRVTVVLRGRSSSYRASAVRGDQDFYQARLAQMATLNPAWARYSGLELDSNGQPTSAAIAQARARGLILVTLEPTQP
jgi:deazaflavin-dependent oxidoreductase (nitroreductase family)